MKIAKATRKYDAWLAERLQLIDADLRQKHQLMGAGLFAFFRATFYRWAQVFPEECSQLMQAPIVLGVGDLHVENFGTWRDREGRLAWGINDFDEACRVPYTVDLVRLAASAHIAVITERLKFSLDRVCESILKGYRDALERGGEPYVLAERHDHLREMARYRLKDADKFWDKLNVLPEPPDGIPDTARKALMRMLPDPNLEHRIATRTSGLGSLGRRRFVALAEWHGGMIAREAKELADSAWLFAHPDTASEGILYQQILDHSIRCPDPFVRLKGKWIVRRLAPDCSRIELSSLPESSDGYHLLHAMGFETANVHLGSANASDLHADLRKRDANWLHHAAREMASQVRDDWERWDEYLKEGAVQAQASRM